MKLIAGIDEVGRGPLAGPVVAAAVVFPPEYKNSEINDSKQLSKKKRESLIETIKANALSWSIISVGHRRIDLLNIREASRFAMKLALARVNAEYALVDGNTRLDSPLPHEAIIKGDSKFIQIAAASILAKVYRDHLMEVLDCKYPGYGFAKHAGYPTKFHREAIAKLGPCPIHRTTFKGVKEFCIKNKWASKTDRLAQEIQISAF